jgi:hypothetical protein
VSPIVVIPIPPNLIEQLETNKYRVEWAMGLAQSRLRDWPETN